MLNFISQIASCPIVYDPQNPVTSGQIASRNPNFNIPYEEQQNLLEAVEQLYKGNVNFVIIKVKGGGANLPGFTLNLMFARVNSHAHHICRVLHSYFDIDIQREPCDV